MSVKFLRRFVLLAALVAVVGVGLYYAREKTYLRVASGPERSELYRIVGAFQQALTEDGNRLRVRRVATETARHAREAMDEKKVDLAILRADQEQPRNAETIAVVRRDLVFLITPPKSPIDSLKDLSGKTIGLMGGVGSDERLLNALLGYYNIEPGKVARVAVEPASAGAMAAQKKFAALFVVGQAGSGAAQEAFASIARVMKGAPGVVAIDEAEAIAKRFPYFDTTEMPEGAFGGASPQPEEAATTLSLGYRLLVRRDMSALHVESLARQLMARKPRMAILAPAAAQIEAPETGKDAYFRVHPGAAAYFDGEETSLFDRFESLFYIGAALMSVVGSLGAWLVSRMRKRDVDDPGEHVRGVLDLLTLVREADARQLDEIELKAEEQLRWALLRRADGKVEDEDVAAMSIALEQARRSIDQRRARLGDGGGGRAPDGDGNSDSP